MFLLEKQKTTVQVKSLRKMRLELFEVFYKTIITVFNDKFSTYTFSDNLHVTKQNKRDITTYSDSSRAQ